MSVRTDLAIEAHEMLSEGALDAAAVKVPDGVSVKNEQCDYANITIIRVENEAGQKALGKRKGLYITVEIRCEEINSFEIQRGLSSELAGQLKRFTSAFKKEKGPVLVIGLGNRYITPDSLGTCVAEKILATHHIKRRSDEIDSDFFDRTGDVCTFSAGVMGITGIESAEVIKGLAEQTKPCGIIVVDALAARKTSRINGAIQITDTGIVPGSGVGNRRFEISEEQMGVPVISIGVPTVVDAITLTRDILSSGGTQMSAQSEAFLSEIERNVGENMIVTPKNVDIAIERMAKVIADSINMTLHDDIDINEINEFFL